jgi:cell wall-associated NlpC family hydrolase
MPENGRMPSRLLVIALAVPVFAVVYATTFGARVWAALRPAVATFLGATVIGSIYAEEAYRRTPQTPLRAAAVIGLAVALVAPGVAPAPVRAADPAEAVIAAAREYLGHNYQLGAEGPRNFDCSGLIYRAFADAGELPRIGGMRLRAAGYQRWFAARGLFSRQASDARRGDLIVWNNGEHIGIYVGDGKAISALVNPWGVTIHSLGGIHKRVTHVLHVNWGNGDSGNNNNPPGNDPPGNDNPPDNNPPGPDNPQPGMGDGNPGADNGHRTNSTPGQSTDPDRPDGNGNNTDPANGPSANDNQGIRPGVNALATGTMNMRSSADPNARIVGWIGKGGQFKIVDRGNSPAGYLWFEVRTRSGKEGWVYSRWVREL